MFTPHLLQTSLKSSIKLVPLHFSLPHSIVALRSFPEGWAAWVSSPLCVQAVGYRQWANGGWGWVQARTGFKYFVPSCVCIPPGSSSPLMYSSSLPRPIKRAHYSFTHSTLWTRNKYPHISVRAPSIMAPCPCIVHYFWPDHSGPWSIVVHLIGKRVTFEKQPMSYITKLNP